MASLRFKYAPMNAGKSSNLLQTAYNYKERGMYPFVSKPSIDLKGEDTIVSRAMIHSEKVNTLVTPEMNVYNLIIEQLEKNTEITAILIDEAQFLTEAQVKQLSDIAVILNIPVICFGLRTDFLGRLFPGSEALFRYADILEELTTVCTCGKKAIFNARIVNGEYVTEGEQVAIDGIDDCKYISLCPYHFKELVEKINIEEERTKIKKRTKSKLYF